MKNIFLSAFIFSMTMLLVACGGSDDDSSSSATTEGQKAGCSMVGYVNCDQKDVASIKETPSAGAQALNAAGVTTANATNLSTTTNTTGVLQPTAVATNTATGVALHQSVSDSALIAHNAQVLAALKQTTTDPNSVYYQPPSTDSASLSSSASATPAAVSVVNAAPADTSSSGVGAAR